MDESRLHSREKRAGVTGLAEEQAALRGVATLVAGGAPAEQVFCTVAQQVSGLFGADVAAIVRFEHDGTVTVLGDVGGPHEPGARVSLDAGYVVHTVRETGRSARYDSPGAPSGAEGSLARTLGVRSAVASPIEVEGAVWGAITVASLYGGECGHFPGLSKVAERRLTQFTELVASAVANAQAREELSVVSAEQAALRRVAELVAQVGSSVEVFDRVAKEAQGVLETEAVGLLRFEPDDAAILVAQSKTPWEPPPLGTRLALDGENVVARVARTRRPARMDDWKHATGAVGAMADVLGVRSGVAIPIIVAGQLWGTMIAASNRSEPLPPNTEARMQQFTGLVATSIANAASFDQLMASRARLVTAGDAARRRVVHDLHDGAQQQIVHTIVLLKLARQAFRDGRDDTEALVAKALDQAEQANVQLRELAHGILPASLTNGGITAGIAALVERLDLPVRVDAPVERFEPEIEASVYFIVAETLTNVVKHARASTAEVSVCVENGALHVAVRDDGVGGADRDGHGLVGLADRAMALGGRLEVESPAQGGTLVAAALPLLDRSEAGV